MTAEIEEAGAQPYQLDPLDTKEANEKDAILGLSTNPRCKPLTEGLPDPEQQIEALRSRYFEEQAANACEEGELA